MYYVLPKFGVDIQRQLVRTRKPNQNTQKKQKNKQNKTKQYVCHVAIWKVWFKAKLNLESGNQKMQYGR